MNPSAPPVENQPSLDRSTLPEEEPPPAYSSLFPDDSDAKLTGFKIEFKNFVVFNQQSVTLRLIHMS